MYDHKLQSAVQGEYAKGHKSQQLALGTGNEMPWVPVQLQEASSIG
jgi:hypothetical protein